MKYIILLIPIMVLFNCKTNMAIVSSTKQTVFSGVRTVKPYSNYIFKVEVKKETNIFIDSVHIVEQEQCFKVQHIIESKHSASYLSKIDTQGTYYIKSAIRKGRYQKINYCNYTGNKAIIFYTENGKSRTVEVLSFEEEKKTRR